MDIIIVIRKTAKLKKGKKKKRIKNFFCTQISYTEKATTRDQPLIFREVVCFSMESEFYFSNEAKRSFYFRHENLVIFLQILPKFLIYYCRLRLFICCISLVKIFFYYILRQKISNKNHRNPHPAHYCKLERSVLQQYSGREQVQFIYIHKLCKL